MNDYSNTNQCHIKVLDVESMFWFTDLHFWGVKCHTSKVLKADLHFWGVKYQCHTSKVSDLTTDFHFWGVIKCQRRHWVLPPWRDQWYWTSWLLAWKWSGWLASCCFKDFSHFLFLSFLYRQSPCSLIKIVPGDEFHPGRGHHRLGLVHIGSLGINNQCHFFWQPTQ